jgi:hypothetical protein
MSFFTEAINNLAPGASWTVNEDDYATLNWLSPSIPQPSQAAVETEVAILEENYAATEYLLQRQAAYPPLANLANALYEDSIGNPTPLSEYYASYAAVNDLYPPTALASGVLYTGRGAGAGPEDLNVSYYVTFDSDLFPQSDTELYVPGTGTVIAYGSGGEGGFDSMGNCFNPGDYQLQIRRVSSGTVIAEITVPLSPGGQNVAF